MAFGKSAKTAKAKFTAQNKDNTDNNIFLNMRTPGSRLLRVPHGKGTDEVKFLRHWIAMNEDGTWEPSFYDPSDRRPKKPVTIARWNHVTENWDSSGTSWDDNPIDAWIRTLDAEDRKGKRVQERFYLNVIDRTRIVKASDGKIVYPDAVGKFPAEYADQIPTQHNRVLILDGSSSNPDENLDTTYADIYVTLTTTANEEGTICHPSEYDLFLIISEGINPKTKKKKTNYKFTPRAVSTLPEELANLQVFDLDTYPMVWPNAAIEELFSGADYMETVKKYNIKLYPDLVDNVHTAPVAIEEDEALF